MQPSLVAFANECSAIRKWVNHLDIASFATVAAPHSPIPRAFVLVWTASAFESFWKLYLQELCIAVASAKPQKRRRLIRASSVFFYDRLQSLNEGKKLGRWERTAALFDDAVKVPSATFAIPYDNKTVRPQHIRTAWNIFCLDGPDFPTPIHRQELDVLASRRNDIAHGVETPSKVGGLVTANDLLTTIARLEDVAEHCVLAAGRRWS